METRQECGPLLKQINDEMRKNANNALRAKDLTLTQLEALVQLEQAPEGQHSLKELEQILHVAQSTAAGIMSRLEQKGYVAGVECVHTALHHRAEAEERLLSGLTEAERNIFYMLLQKVRNSL